MEKIYALKAPILTTSYLKTLRKACRLPPNCISGCVTTVSIFSQNLASTTEGHRNEGNNVNATLFATQSPINASGSYAQRPGNFGGHGGGRILHKYDAPITRNFQQMRGDYYEPTGQANQPSFSRGSTVNEDDSEDIELNGTIEELDCFLKEEDDLETVVQVLDLLEKKGIPVDLSRYTALLNACDDDKSLEPARYIHSHLMRSIPNIEVSTFNKIIETYMRCGSVVDAFSVFDRIPRNFTSWDTMISGLVTNGYPEAAIDLFTEFKDLGLSTRR